MKKIALLMAVLMLTLSLASCGLMGEKTFTKDGISITVKGFFTEQNGLNEEYNLILISPDAGVMILKETFDSFASVALDTNMSVKEYAKIVATASASASLISLS